MIRLPRMCVIKTKRMRKGAKGLGEKTRTERANYSRRKGSKRGVRVRQV